MKQKNREHNALETFRNLNENKNRLAEKEINKINEAVSARESFRDRYMVIRDMKMSAEAKRTKLMEAARDDALATIVKAIYITALEAETLTDEGLLLAESMVDNWIKENGGATKILNPVKENTYLLSKIAYLVEEAAEETVKEIEEPDTKEKEPTKKEKMEDAIDSAKEFIKDASKKDVKDFFGKVIDKVESEAEKKAEEKIKEKEAEEETEDTASPELDKDDSDGDDEEIDIEVEDDKKDASVESEEKEAEEEVKEEPAKEEAPEEKEAPADDSEEVDIKIDEEEPAKEDESSEDDKEIEVDVEPEEDVKATDSENGTPDTDPEEEKESPADNNETEEVDVEVKEEPAKEETPEETPATDDDKDTLDVADDEDDIDGDGEVSDAEVDDALDSEPLDSDNTGDSDITVDNDTENNGKLFDELDKEDDVKKAIELIRTRVADAEETFIRNNAEDKKKIDELINKISTNVKAVEDLNGKDEAKAEVAKESVRYEKKRIDAIRENRPLTVFEKMTRIIGKNVVKESVDSKIVKETYFSEDGSLDMTSVVETARVMYGFLETINTLQIEKTGTKYIANIIENM